MIFDQIQTVVKYLKFLIFQAYAIVLFGQYEFAAVTGRQPRSAATMTRWLPVTFFNFGAPDAALPHDVFRTPAK